MLRLLAAIVLALIAAQSLPAQAQYPNRQVTIVVPLAAGSGMDVLVRLYADKLAQSLGKPLGLGLVALALTLALVGYCATRLAWRAYVVAAWRRRSRARRAA